MKNGFLFFSFLLLFNGKFSAQTFSSTGDTIPDTQNGRTFYLAVNGLPNTLNATSGLKTICLNISHNRVSDLGIFLIDPSGYPLELSTGNGGNGHDYTATCFDMSATAFIEFGTAPFTGNFRSEHNIGIVNNNQNPNALWKLKIIDYAAGYSGYLIDWSLTFGTNAPLPIDSQNNPCNLLNSDGCVCADTAQHDCYLLPDMIISDHYLKSPYVSEDTGKMLISTSNANIGFGPLELIGSGQWYCGDSLVSGSGLCPDGNYSKQLVRQRIYKKTTLGYFDYLDTAVGTMSFHADVGHQHLHIDDWSENSIRIKGPESDPRFWKVISKGKKVSFNIYDHVRCGSAFKTCEYDGTINDFYQLPNRGLGLGYESGSNSVQGISVGYSDVYSFLTSGQEVYLDSTVCNGDYYIVSVYDNKKIFLDYDRTNDVSIAPVTLTKQKSNCCKAEFRIDTIDVENRVYRFVDESVPMPSSWNWHFTANDSSSEQFPTFQFPATGNFVVSLQTITAQACTDLFTKQFQVPASSSVQELENDWSINVFPIPFSNEITVCSEKNALIEVFDVIGERVMKTAIVKNEIKKIPIFQKGILFLKVSNGNKSFVKKIINQ